MRTEVIVPSVIVALGSVLSLVLASLAGLHAHWALGGRWGLDAALGGHGAPLREVIWAVALGLAVGALLALGRLGVWDPVLPSPVFGYGVWGLVVAFALAGVVNLAGRTALERFGFAPFCLTLALLLAAVARSEIA